MSFVPPSARAFLIVGAVITVFALAFLQEAGSRPPRRDGQSAAEYREQERAAAVIERREAKARELVALVKRRLHAGDEREAVRAWAEQRQREIQADAQREIDGK